MHNRNTEYLIYFYCYSVLNNCLLCSEVLSPGNLKGVFLSRSGILFPSFFPPLISTTFDHSGKNLISHFNSLLLSTYPFGKLSRDINRCRFSSTFLRTCITTSIVWSWTRPSHLLHPQPSDSTLYIQSLVPASIHMVWFCYGICVLFIFLLCKRWSHIRPQPSSSSRAPAQWPARSNNRAAHITHHEERVMHNLPFLLSL